MLEIASQMILCLLLAALIGAIIGYILGKSTCENGDCGHDKEDTSNTETQSIATAASAASASSASKTTSKTKKPSASSASKASASKGTTASKGKGAKGVSNTKKDAKSTSTATAKAQGIASTAKGSTSGKATPKDTSANEEVAMSTPTVLSAPREGGKDNLTRIKGIGVKIDEALNGIGIYHFDQIGAWGEENLAWADSNLGFPGRAKRENWVEQATALAAGKETEFSQRVDAGEVSSSKKK